MFVDDSVFGLHYSPVLEECKFTADRIKTFNDIFLVSYFKLCHSLRYVAWGLNKNRWLLHFGDFISDCTCLLFFSYWNRRVNIGLNVSKTVCLLTVVYSTVMLYCSVIVVFPNNTNKYFKPTEHVYKTKICAEYAIEFFRIFFFQSQKTALQILLGRYCQLHLYLNEQALKCLWFLKL